MSSHFVILLGVVVSARHPQDEKDRVAIRMNDLTQEQLQASGYFWVDHDRVIALATLQDRLKTEQERYISIFTNMETMINQFNSQASYLSQISG